MSKDNGGPAFPFPMGTQSDQYASSPGMFLRDYFAAQALTGMGAWVPNKPDDTYPIDQADVLATKAAWAYAMADAMLAERAKGGDA